LSEQRCASGRITEESSRDMRGDPLILVLSAISTDDRASVIMAA
jgi:hypothetical protein